MKIILSPSKRQVARAMPGEVQYPKFMAEAERIHKLMAGWSTAVIARRLAISATLAGEVQGYLARWSVAAHESGTPAFLLYRGDVYDGLEADSLSSTASVRAAESLIILSAMYGLLRGGDWALPHRLDLKDKLKVGTKTLQVFWQPKVRLTLAGLSDELIVDLSSSEYAALLPRSLPDAIRVDFREESGGQLKAVSYFAKRARGRFARWLLENPTENPVDLKRFDGEGYRFDAKRSGESHFLFLR